LSPTNSTQKHKSNEIKGSKWLKEVSQNTMTGKYGKPRLNRIDKYQIIDIETGSIVESFRLVHNAEQYMRDHDLLETCKLEVNIK